MELFFFPSSKLNKMPFDTFSFSSFSIAFIHILTVEVGRIKCLMRVKVKIYCYFHFWMFEFVSVVHSVVEAIKLEWAQVQFIELQRGGGWHQIPISKYVRLYFLCRRPPNAVIVEPGRNSLDTGSEGRTTDCTKREQHFDEIKLLLVPLFADKAR